MSGKSEMEFTYRTRREWNRAAQRSVVMGTDGMVAASQPLATLAGTSVVTLSKACKSEFSDIRDA